MNYLLDTNVISEWTKQRPDLQVIAWLSNADEDRVFLSVITLAEIRYGVERMPQGARRVALSRWLEEDLPERFETRILSVDAEIADTCGRMMARRSDRQGMELTTADGLLAATARVHQLILVTRNTKDFGKLDITLLNPWTGK